MVGEPSSSSATTQSASATQEDLDALAATFARPDLITRFRLDEFRLRAVGQRRKPDQALLACRVVDADVW